MLTTWTFALFFSLVTYTFSDDHFGRISPGRQIARYGELPFRDFFDPGFVLTDLASAAVQRLFGDNLLGEMLLTSSCVAAGAVLIAVLVRRATGSFVLAVVTASLAVTAFSRPYDYDKFLFYPLGLLACWRYTDTRRRRDLVVVAAVAVVAGMFRYDNGLFVGVCGLVMLAAMHAREFRVLIGRTALLVGAGVACVVPFAVFLQLNGGLTEAVRQISTYARREGARTQIGTLPEGALSELRVTPMPPPPPDRVQVRWTPAADGERTALEAGYTLHDGIQRGDPQDRTWLYEIDNAAPANLRTIVNDPRVADTHLIDRTRFTLNPQESLRRRLWRRLPFVGSHLISWNSGGAAAVMFYLFLAVSLGAVVAAMRVRGAPAERARLLSAAVMTLLAVAFILRAPVVARIGGVIGPPAVLAAWGWHRYAQWRLVRGALAVGVIATLAIASEVARRARTGLSATVRASARVVRDAATTPPDALLAKAAAHGTGALRAALHAARRSGVRSVVRAGVVFFQRPRLCRRDGRDVRRPLVGARIPASHRREDDGRVRARGAGAGGRRVVLEGLSDRRRVSWRPLSPGRVQRLRR